MSKHTPGKWANIKGYIVVKSGHTIASVNSYNTSVGKANASLIAASPKILEALKVALEAIGSEDDGFIGRALMLGREAVEEAENISA